MPSRWRAFNYLGEEQDTSSLSPRFLSRNTITMDGETNNEAFQNRIDEGKVMGLVGATQFTNLGGFRLPPSIQKQPTYFTLWRGTDNPADQSAIRSGSLLSNAMKEGVPPNKLNTSFLGKVRHSFDSSNPPSQFVSLTSSRTVANRFGGTVFEVQVHRNRLTRAWWNPFGEREFLAPGGTRVFNVKER